MRGLVVAVAIILVAPHAAAQAPLPQPTVGQWVRLTLNDGRAVDGQITGGDANNYFIQTAQGYFSILRVNVVAISGLAPPVQAAPPPMPMPIPNTPPQPVASPEGDDNRNELGRAAGIAYFGISYAITAMAASAKSDEDDTAKLGYIPIAGPMLWALADDEDDFGEDGWDWLAMLGSATQAGGLFLMIGGNKSDDKKTKVTAISTKSFSGVSIIGRW